MLAPEANPQNHALQCRHELYPRCWQNGTGETRLSRATAEVPLQRWTRPLSATSQSGHAGGCDVEKADHRQNKIGRAPRSSVGHKHSDLASRAAAICTEGKDRREIPLCSSEIPGKQVAERSARWMLPVQMPAPPPAGLLAAGVKGGQFVATELEIAGPDELRPWLDAGERQHSPQRLFKEPPGHKEGPKLWWMLQKH